MDFWSVTEKQRLKNLILNGLSSICILFIMTGCARATATVIPTPVVLVTEALPEKPTALATVTDEPSAIYAETSTSVAETPTREIQPMVPKVSSTDSEKNVGMAGYALRFFGTGSGDIDRVKIAIDDPKTSVPGPPADIGATDFTLEWWMRADLTENEAGLVGCGPDNVNWIYGNIIFDRDRYNQDRKFGISLADGRIIFGLSGDGSGDYTLCSTSNVADEQWHHVVVQRRRADGYLWLFVDGHLEAKGVGPGGDVSYPDDGQPGDFCDGPCLNSDPFLVIGAEKHDAGPEYPSYSGWIDEVRLSKVLRYNTDFVRPTVPFEPDVNTAALWHIDEGTGEVMHDAVPGGLSVGFLRVGGPHQGPQWVISDAPLGR